MTFTDVTAGGTDAFGLAIEYDLQAGTGTPGTPVAPSTFVPVTDMGLVAPWTFVEPEVARGTLMTHAIMERQLIDPAGPISYLLNSALGTEFLLLTLGAKTALTAVSAVTTGAIVTANGVSTIPVTGSYTVGAQVDIGTGATKERRQIMSYSAGSMTVGALVANAAAVTGATVNQVAQDKYANSILPSGKLSQLPTATGEVIHGNGIWSLQFPYLMSNGLSLEFGQNGVTSKCELVGSSEPNFGNAAGTSPATFTASTYAPNSTQEAIALKPLTLVDSYIGAFGDPDASGTSVVRAALGVTDAKIEFKNDMEKIAVIGRSSYLYVPSGKASCQISYNELQTSKRPDIWYDAIKTSVANPFFIGAWKNHGTLSSPSYKGVACHVPTMRFNQQTDTTKVGSVDRWAKAGKALAPAGGAQDYLQVFVAN